MVLLFNKKSDSNEIKVVDSAAQVSKEDKPQTSKPAEKTENKTLSAELAKLKSEEQQLQIQKLRLVDYKEKMELKLAQEVEARRIRINNLKAEIPALENDCKNLAAALEIPPLNLA